MKIKLFTYLSVAIIATSIATAQSTDEAKISFAVLGGLNFQNLNGKDNSGDNLKNDMILGYHAGVNVQIRLVPEFYFQPGLLFTTKGAKNISDGVTSTYNLSYIEMPLNFVYKGLLGSGHVMIGFGPYIAYGVKGKASYEGGIISIKHDITFQNSVESSDPLIATYFRAFDAGANIFAGYEFSNGIFLQLNTQLGLIKINPDDMRISDNEASVKNTGFGFSLGYRF